MEKFTCEACGGTYKTKAELDAHMQRDHADQPSETTIAGQPNRKEN
jgi:hypothetical protein